jgi:hypothetical protein
MNEELIKEFWKVINQIEEQNTKLNSCRSIISICAERALGDDSGALWASSDILGNIESEMDENIQNLLQVYRQIKEPPKVKKK